VRFANRLLEPVWSNHHVERIEIVYDEQLTLENRAGYYDTAGALVDMVQSHLLQVMALLMMEPIRSVDERTFRDAKAEVLRATRVRGAARTASRRARYTGGRIGNRSVPGATREFRIPKGPAGGGTVTGLPDFLRTKGAQYLLMPSGQTLSKLVPMG
jgi:glucose-6-phosphate 1-dehydrogenase